MKKALLIVLSFIWLPLMVGCSDGPLALPSTGELIEPDAAYELDTWGANSEIYEFTPRTALGKTCVVFMLDSGKAMGLFCFDK